METNFKCSFCDEDYDLSEKTPWILNCGHSICLSCLRDHMKRGLPIVCSSDGSEI